MSIEHILIGGNILTNLEGNVLEDDDRVLGRIFLQQGLEVGGAGGQDHLVSLAALPV